MVLYVVKGFEGVVTEDEEAQKLAFDDKPTLLTTVYQPKTLQQRLGYLRCPGSKKMDLYKMFTIYLFMKYAIIMNEIFPKNFPHMLTLCRAQLTGRRTRSRLTFGHIRDELVAMPKAQPGWEGDETVSDRRRNIPVLGAAALLLQLEELQELNAALQSRDDDELDEMQARQKNVTEEVNSGRCFGTGFNLLRKHDLPDVSIRDIKAPIKLLFDGEEAEEQLSRLLLLNTIAGEYLRHGNSQKVWKKPRRFDPRQIGKPPAWMSTSGAATPSGVQQPVGQATAAHIAPVPTFTSSETRKAGYPPASTKRRHSF